MTLLHLLSECRMPVQLSENSCKTLTSRMGQLLFFAHGLVDKYFLMEKKYSFLNLSPLVSNFKAMLSLSILPARKGQLTALCPLLSTDFTHPQLCLLAFSPEKRARQDHCSLSHPRWSLPQPGDSQQPPGQRESTARQVWGGLSLCAHQLVKLQTAGDVLDQPVW